MGEVFSFFLGIVAGWLLTAGLFCFVFIFADLREKRKFLERFWRAEKKL